MARTKASLGAGARLAGYVHAYDGALIDVEFHATLSKEIPASK